MRRPAFDPSWPPEVQEIYRNDLREVWDPSLEPQMYALYQNQLRLYKDLADRLRAATVLDVGCAQGTLGLLMAESGRSVTAVDIRPSFLSYARARHERGAIRFVEANVMDGPPLGEFDLVFANQIIEHLVHPVEFLSSLKRYVKTAGSLVVTTPNQQYIRSNLPRYADLGDPAQHEHRQFSAGGGDHFFAYTAGELRQFVESAGLQVADSFFFESPWISGHMKVRYLHAFLPQAALELADKLTLRLVGRALGHQLAVVARRQ